MILEINIKTRLINFWKYTCLSNVIMGLFMRFGFHISIAGGFSKIIERAKGILMKRGPLDEQEAFRRLQKLANDESRKLIDIAHMILVAERAVQPASKG